METAFVISNWCIWIPTFFNPILVATLLTYWKVSIPFPLYKDICETPFHFEEPAKLRTDRAVFQEKYFYKTQKTEVDTNILLIFFQT